LTHRIVDWQWLSFRLCSLFVAYKRWWMSSMIKATKGSWIISDRMTETAVSRSYGSHQTHSTLAFSVQTQVLGPLGRKWTHPKVAYILFKGKNVNTRVNEEKCFWIEQLTITYRITDWHYCLINDSLPAWVMYYWMNDIITDRMPDTAVSRSYGSHQTQSTLASLSKHKVLEHAREWRKRLVNRNNDSHNYSLALLSLTGIAVSWRHRIKHCQDSHSRYKHNGLVQ
jgi:hypothetical protein